MRSKKTFYCVTIALLIFSGTTVSASLAAPTPLEEIRQTAEQETQPSDSPLPASSQTQSTVDPYPYVHSAWFSFGTSNDKLGSANTYELGYRGNSHWGISGTLITNSETSNVDTETQLFCVNGGSSCYTDLGSKRKGSTLGVDVKYFFYSKEDSAFQPFVGLGLYMTTKVDVVQSNTSGQKLIKGSFSNKTVADAEKTEFSGNAEVGFLYRLGRFLVGGSVGVVKTQLSLGMDF